MSLSVCVSTQDFPLAISVSVSVLLSPPVSISASALISHQVSVLYLTVYVKKDWQRGVESRQAEARRETGKETETQPILPLNLEFVSGGHYVSSCPIDMLPPPGPLTDHYGPLTTVGHSQIASDKYQSLKTTNRFGRRRQKTLHNIWTFKLLGVFTIPSKSLCKL